MESLPPHQKFSINTIGKVLIATLCLIALPVQAQFIDGPYNSVKYKPIPFETVDTARLMAVYGHWMHDARINQDDYDDDILQIGSHSSQYTNYGFYRIDSLFNARYPQGGSNMMYFATATSVPNTTHLKYTFKNLRDSLLTDQISIGLNNYKYSEAIPEMDWEILDEPASTYRNLSCQKAVCHFRGRDWTAWFAPDIPVSDGPWKFHGLPGLIVYVTDSEKVHIFAMLNLWDPKAKGQIEPIKVKKESYSISTTREKSLKRAGEIALDPRLLIEEGFTAKQYESLKDIPKLGFYAPLELE